MKVFKRFIGALKDWMKSTVSYNRVSPFGVMYVPVVEPMELVCNKPTPVGETVQLTAVEPTLPALDVVVPPVVAPLTLSADQLQTGVEVCMTTTDIVTTTTTTEQVVPVTYYSPGHAIGLDLIMANSPEPNELESPTPITHSIEVFVEAARKPRLRAKKEATPVEPAPELLVPLKAKRKRSPRNKTKKKQSGETK